MKLSLTFFVVAALGATATWAQDSDKKTPSDPKSASTVLPFKLDAKRTYDFRAVCEISGAANVAAARGGETRLLYRLTQLRGNPGSGGYEVSVLIDADASPVKGEDKGLPPPIDSNKNDADGDKAGGLLGKDQQARKSVTVQVDSSGKITSMTGLEELRSQIRTEGTMADLAALDACQMHLSLILGSGLHGEALREGGLYSIACDACAPPAREKESMVAAAGNPKMRFDGVSSGFARFSIVISPAPQLATGGNEADKVGETPIGTASYSIDDGLIQSLNGRMEMTTGTGTATPPPAGSAPVARFSIERLGSDARIEPPR